MSLQIKRLRRLSGKGGTASLADSTLSFMIWNIGYAGLGAEVEFFYEHSSLVFSGRTIRAEKDISQAYFREIEQFIAAQKVDFFLLQEIDRPSRRSHSTDQVAALANRLPGFAADFFVNYQVCWVPVPLLEPWHAYGQVSSGLATYSRVQPTSSVRYQLPGQFAWPSRMFMLDRCIGVSRFSLANRNELVVVSRTRPTTKAGKSSGSNWPFSGNCWRKNMLKAITSWPGVTGIRALRSSNRNRSSRRSRGFPNKFPWIRTLCPQPGVGCTILAIRRTEA